MRFVCSALLIKSAFNILNVRFGKPRAMVDRPGRAVCVAHGRLHVVMLWLWPLCCRRGCDFGWGCCGSGCGWGNGCSSGGLPQPHAHGFPGLRCMAFPGFTEAHGFPGLRPTSCPASGVVPLASDPLFSPASRLHMIFPGSIQTLGFPGVPGLRCVSWPHLAPWTVPFQCKNQYMLAGTLKN